jgi:hypothetical protein
MRTVVMVAQVLVAVGPVSPEEIMLLERECREVLVFQKRLDGAVLVAEGAALERRDQTHGAIAVERLEVQV